MSPFTGFFYPVKGDIYFFMGDFYDVIPNSLSSSACVELSNTFQNS